MTARPRHLLLLTLAALVALYTVESTPAGAHDDEGQLTVTAAEQVAPGLVRLEVGLVYTGDGHLAEEATVEAALTGPDGEVVGPVDLPRTSGSLYGAQVEVTGPGTWQVSVNATNPAATAESSVEVAAETPNTPPPAITPDTVTPEGLGTDATPRTVPATETDGQTDDTGDDGVSVGVIVAVLVVVALAAGGAYLWYRRRRATPPPD